MQWYIEKLDAIKDNIPIYSVCGDDCAVCPRFLAQTEEELRQTAEFWYKTGWRDHVVTNEEIRCTGCGCRPTCSFMLLSCTNEHNVHKCNECANYQCEKIDSMLKSSAKKMEQCRQACDTEEEFQMLVRAFYEKEKHL